MPDQEDPKDWESFFSLFPHGVIVLKEGTIVHAVGYPQPATQADADQLRTELAWTDLQDYHIVPLSGAEWRKYVTFFTGD